MRGLLTKDFCLLAGQKRFFIIVIAIAVLFLITGQNETFVIGYVTMLCTFFSISTIHYDEFNKGSSFLFTLPFGRKEYALEKYLFGIILGVLGWLVSSVAGIAIASTKRTVDFGEWGTLVLAYLPVLLIMLSLMIPIELKFGAEKGRIASFIVFFVIFGFCFLGSEMADILGLDLSGMLENLSMERLALAAVVFTLLVLAVSVSASIKIMEKKQF